MCSGFKANSLTARIHEIQNRPESVCCNAKTIIQLYTAVWCIGLIVVLQRKHTGKVATVARQNGLVYIKPRTLDEHRKVGETTLAIPTTTYTLKLLLVTVVSVNVKHQFIERNVVKPLFTNYLLFY